MCTNKTIIIIFTFSMNDVATVITNVKDLFLQ